MPDAVQNADVAGTTTIGVDLAAEPKNTALATIVWAGDSATVTDVRLGIGDVDIVAAAAAAAKIGIDAPFGWPDAFVDFVSAHHIGQVPTISLSTREQRRPLIRRVTDGVVQQRTGVVPLSVSADRIAHVALRCAGVLAQLNTAGGSIDRVDGVAVEVYPAAALRSWELPHRGYKGQAAPGFGTLVDEFFELTPRLNFGSFAQLCRSSDDAFDAVIAAMIAHAAYLGRTWRPTAREAIAAQREGWIHVPVGPMSELFEAAPPPTR